MLVEGAGRELVSTSRVAFFSPPPSSHGDMMGDLASIPRSLPLLSLIWEREAVRSYPPHLPSVLSPGQTADSSPGNGFSHCRLCSHKTPPARRVLPWISWNSLGPRKCHPEAEGRMVLSQAGQHPRPDGVGCSDTCLCHVPMWLVFWQNSSS